jgi:hypothetical protein
MPAKAVRISALFVLLMAGGMQASAQTPAPPQEDVTVTATKSREALHNFVKKFAAPTKLSGKIARWQRRLCPLVIGQEPDFTAFITQRIKYVALAVGAHVNLEPSCTPNIQVVFTSTPQALLDNVRQHHASVLGYAETVAQLDKLATLTRPIQAWYATETMDCDGRRQVDAGITVSHFTGDFKFDAPAYAACGLSRLRDGLRTGFAHVLIVVDSTKLAGQKIVPLADYISMLALTQLDSLDVCQQQPSVANLLATGCDNAPDGLTEFDLAYLRGLYSMSADRLVLIQRDEIGDSMLDTLTKEEK